MEKIFKVIIIVVVLWVLDTLVSTLFGALYGFIRQTFFKDIYGLKSTAEGALFLNIMRIVYYWAFFIPLFILLFIKLPIDSKLSKLIILNCGLYILLSLLYAFVLKPDTKDLLSDPLFFILIISTALSPIILWQIPYFRRLIESI